MTRLPTSAFVDQTIVRSRGAYRPDSAAVARMLALLGGRDAVQVLLSGHSHFDHSFDAAMWAKLTHAEVYGPRTTCYQLVAQDVPASRCTAVEGGETIPLGEGVTVRVVRWNHSGDHAINPEQHDPTELAGVPTRDPTNGGLRPGLADDFPNGGGSRAYLFTIPTRDGPVTIFFSNTGSPVDLDRPIVIDGNELRRADRQPARGAARCRHRVGRSLDRQRRRAARAARAPRAAAEGVSARALGRLLRPDRARASRQPYADPALEPLLDTAHVTLVRPAQYLDRWRLDRSGVHAVANDAPKRALGLPQ